MESILTVWFVLLLCYLAVLAVLQSVIGGLSIYSLLHRPRIGGEPEPQGEPAVAVVIAAHNEESTLVETLESLSSQTLRPHDIIVIDDGSTDQTAVRAKAGFGVTDSGSPNVRMLSTERQGLHRAQQLGISMVDCELTCIADADVEIDPNALERLCRHFKERRATAVGAWVWPSVPAGRIGLISRLLVFCQIIEYARAILWRPGWEALGGLSIVEGRLGLFETKALKSLQNSETKQSAVDYNLTMSLYRSARERKVPCRIGMEPRATVWTDVPLNMGDFFAQRMRYARGFLKAFVKNRDMLFRRDFGSLGMLELPVRIFTSVCSIVELCLWLTCILFLILDHPWAGKAWAVCAIYMVFVIFQLYLSLTLGKIVTSYKWRGYFDLFLWLSVPLAAVIWEPIKGLTRMAGWSKLSLDRPWTPRRARHRFKSPIGRSDM